MPVPSKSLRGLPHCLCCWLTVSALAQSGKVLSLRAALPWWSYRKEKRDDSAHAAG